MREFRARDDDRDRCVELIEAAYADGQLGDADRDLRLARAKSARTLDDLQTLTRDLRVPAATGVVRAGAPRLQPPSRHTSRTGLWVAAAVLGVLALVPVGLFSAVSTDSSSSTAVDEWAVVEEPAAVEEPGASFEMAPAPVRRFLRDYEQEFGTTDTFEVVFSPSLVTVSVPVSSSRSRATRWSYDGSWRKEATATAVRGSAEVVDLDTIDVRRLFANIARATKVLRVEQAELTRVVVRRQAGDAPVLDIHVGNAFDERGHLSTTPAGQEIRRFPRGA